MRIGTRATHADKADDMGQVGGVRGAAGGQQSVASEPAMGDTPRLRLVCGALTKADERTINGERHSYVRLVRKTAHPEICGAEEWLSDGVPEVTAESSDDEINDLAESIDHVSAQDGIVVVGTKQFLRELRERLIDEVAGNPRRRASQPVYRRVCSWRSRSC